MSCKNCEAEKMAEVRTYLRRRLETLMAHPAVPRDDFEACLDIRQAPPSALLTSELARYCARLEDLIENFTQRNPNVPTSDTQNKAENLQAVPQSLGASSPAGHIHGAGEGSPEVRPR